MNCQTSTIRHLFRRTGKRVLTETHHWLDRRRFPHIFSSINKASDVGVLIESYLHSGQPFCVGRMGHVEARLLGEWFFRGSSWSRATRLEAHANAGVFPVTDTGLSSFALNYSQSLSKVDLLGFWQSDYQAALVSAMSSRPTLCHLSALEPFRQSNPWSQALAGLSVLVVHPFCDSIESQYHRYGSTLFRDSRVLPAFDLQLCRPPVTHAPLTEGFHSWSDAFMNLQDRVLNYSFDVALLGCGSYGLPLAAALKSQGRMSIHLGGALQLLFGICGRRWDNDLQIQQLATEHWTRPSPAETPVRSTSIEGGCYW